MAVKLESRRNANGEETHIYNLFNPEFLSGLNIQNQHVSAAPLKECGFFVRGRSVLRSLPL